MATYGGQFTLTVNRRSCANDWSKGSDLTVVVDSQTDAMLSWMLGKCGRKSSLSRAVIAVVLIGCTVCRRFSTGHHNGGE